LAIGKGNQAMVGDGYAMGVAAQILEHILWAPEGSFGIDHPVFSEEWPQPGGEGLPLSERSQISVEAELAVAESTLESGNELATEEATEHFDGKKEGVAWFDPVRAMGRQTAGGNHAMDMRVELEFLIPGV
jgi:hypothetical protein